MPTPITLNPAPFQLRGDLTPEQVSSLVSLIAGANLIALPALAKWVNATGLNISVLPDGNGVITISFHQ
jgi:hypothetical protein